MSSEFTSFGQLERLKICELVQIYNSVAPRKIQTFRDKETAVRRTMRMIASQQGKLPITRTPEFPSTASLSTLSGVRRGPPPGPSWVKRRRKRFFIPPGEEITGHRQGTRTAYLIEMLVTNGGATLEEVTAQFGWTPYQASAAVKTLSKRGYGIYEAPNGIIRLVLPGKWQETIAS